MEFVRRFGRLGAITPASSNGRTEDFDSSYEGSNPSVGTTFRTLRDTWDADVLKASHHGSFNGANGTVDGKTWMDFVTPEDVVISVLANSEAMTAYENVVGGDNIHCTSRHGTVRIFGFADGHHRIVHQFSSDDSCRFAD